MTKRKYILRDLIYSHNIQLRIILILLYIYRYIEWYYTQDRYYKYSIF